MWRNEDPCVLLVECRLCSHCDLEKLKMDLPVDQAIPPLGMCLKEAKTLIKKNISTPVLTAALFTIVKICKRTKCPSIDEWIKQLWAIYAMKYYSAIKKKKVLPFVTVWMDLENVMLSETSQSEKDKYHIISRICGI